MITPAYAQTAPAAGGADILVQMLPFILIFVIMYFLLIRPQQKRVKAHQEMVKNVRRGDTVVLNSGMIGKVTKVIDDARGRGRDRRRRARQGDQDDDRRRAQQGRAGRGQLTTTPGR